MKNHDAWFEMGQGKELLAYEKEQCRSLIPTAYYPYCAQIGMPYADFSSHLEIGHKTIVSRYQSDVTKVACPSGKCVQALPESLPFAEKSQNLIIMPHTLEFCANPHAVLREINQTLTSDGCLVISGFNPISLWGGVRLIKSQFDSSIPWGGHYYRLRRVQDWLSLLGFDMVGGSMMGYHLPLQSERWQPLQNFMDSAGDRWWPGLGAVYLLVAKKREVSVRKPSGKRLKWRKLIPEIAQPAAQQAAKVHYLNRP